jgi:hypothetical protein
VSGSGLTVPFGRGSANENWLYPLNNQGSLNVVIDTPPEKRIALNGSAINLQNGAKIDLSGGGDLYAYEFISGPGGSNDVLDPSSSGYAAGSYAVIPGVSNILTPYDPLEFSAAGLQVGQSVYLSGGNGLAAGTYTLLPAHYALLPGAYLVTPRAGTDDLAAGQRAPPSSRAATTSPTPASPMPAGKASLSKPAASYASVRSSGTIPPTNSSPAKPRKRAPTRRNFRKTPAVWRWRPSIA